MEGSQIIIGEYTIYKLDDGSFWIKHKSGEGMGVSAADLIKLITDFYEATF